MAIGTENAFSGPYTANGVTTEFPFTFSVLAATQVAVTLIDADGAETTADPGDYTVDLNGTAPTDGTVIFATAPATGYEVVPLLDMPFTQETQFVDGSAWKASPANNVNDRAALRDQILKRETDRALKLSVGDTAALPGAAARASKFLAFDADGNVLLSSGTGADAGLRTDLGEVTGAALVGLTHGNLGDAIDWLTPEMFGAVGDGVTDDQTAFEALAAAVNAANGGSIRFTQGATYLVGKQTAGGGVYYLAPGYGLEIHDCESVTLDFNGANFKMNPLKFGSFNATTGLPSAPVLPVYDYSIRADPGGLFKFEDNERVVLTGAAVMDLNGSNMILGGEWGDIGYQIAHYGIELYGNGSTNTDGCNVKIKNSLLDGLAIGSTGLTAASARQPITLRGIHVENVGRNCISVIGSNDLLIDKCSMVNSGRGPKPGGGYITSAPGSAYDIEAESSVNRNVRITNSVMIEGPLGGAAFVADSGDSRDILVENCIIDGRISVSRLGTVFKNCQINGRFTKVATGGVGDATLIDGCFGNDTPIYSAAVTGYFIDTEGSGPGAVMRDCVFTLANIGINGRGLTMLDCTITFDHVPAKIANQQPVGLFDNALTVLRRCNFIDSLSGYTATEGLYIQTDGATVEACNITFVAGLLKWNSWSNGGGGYPRTGRTDGRHDRGSASFQEVRFQREGTFGGGENEWTTVRALSSAPSPTGLKAGSFVYNIGAAVGGIGGWLLDSGGTFRACGIVGAIRAAQPTVTYVAATGGATVDAEARAALVQLAADVADIRTKLATANLTA